MPATTDLSRQLPCQIWSRPGAPNGASLGAPDGRMTLTEGGATTITAGVPWRVYAVRNQDLRVMVGDRVDMRDGLVAGVVSRLLWPAAVLFPLLAGLIWLSVGRGLPPLEAALRAQRPNDLRPPAGCPRPARDPPRQARWTPQP